MNIHSSTESKVGNFYGLLVLIVATIVIVFLFCDFDVLPDKYCAQFDSFTNYLSDKLGM